MSTSGTNCICDNESFSVKTTCFRHECGKTFDKKLTRHERLMKCEEYYEPGMFRGGYSRSEPICDDCKELGYRIKCDQNDFAFLPEVEKK